MTAALLRIGTCALDPRASCVSSSPPVSARHPDRARGGARNSHPHCVFPHLSSSSLWEARQARSLPRGTASVCGLRRPPRTGPLAPVTRSQRPSQTGVAIPSGTMDGKSPFAEMEMGARVPNRCSLQPRYNPLGQREPGSAARSRRNPPLVRRRRERRSTPDPPRGFSPCRSPNQGARPGRPTCKARAGVPPRRPWRTGRPPDGRSQTCRSRGRGILPTYYPCRRGSRSARKRFP